jgi:hypothetical protein
VAKLFCVKLSGFPAWWLYLTVYLWKTPGLARKLRIVIDWTLDLVFSRDIIAMSVPYIPSGRALAIGTPADAEESRASLRREGVGGDPGQDLRAGRRGSATGPPADHSADSHAPARAAGR